jgi:hypothetical protein
MTERPSNADAWGMAWEGRAGHAYDQSAFRYLLARERQRSVQLAVPLLLLLVELRPSPTPPRVRVDAATLRIFSVLARCVRETDIMGWYQRNRVAGIVFTDVGARSLAEVSSLFRARVVAALDRELPGSMAARVNVRIHRSPRPNGWIGVSTHRKEDEC